MVQVTQTNHKINPKQCQRSNSNNKSFPGSKMQSQGYTSSSFTQPQYATSVQETQLNSTKKYSPIHSTVKNTSLFQAFTTIRSSQNSNTEAQNYKTAVTINHSGSHHPHTIQNRRNQAPNHIYQESLNQPSTSNYQSLKPPHRRKEYQISNRLPSQAVL